MAKIESGRWSEMLRRSLGMKGQEVVASELAPEVSPTWTLEGNTVEWQFLKGVRASVCAQQIGAGSESLFRLNNPTTSGLLGVITLITVSVATDNPVKIYLHSAGDTDLPVADIGFMRDTRWLDPGVTSDKTGLSFSQSTSGGPSGRAIWQGLLLASEPLEIQLPLVLSPGYGIDVYFSSAASCAGRICIQWLERAVTALELS